MVSSRYMICHHKHTITCTHTHTCMDKWNPIKKHNTYPVHAVHTVNAVRMHNCAYVVLRQNLHSLQAHSKNTSVHLDFENCVGNIGNISRHHFYRRNLPIAYLDTGKDGQQRV